VLSLTLACGRWIERGATQLKTTLRHRPDTPFLLDAIRDLVIVVVGIRGALWLESRCLLAVDALSRTGRSKSSAGIAPPGD
jgi:hypothetical protein